MTKRRSKSKRKYSRKLNTKEIKQRFLIVCEGKKTEPSYFKCFRVPTVIINIQGVGKNPSRIIKKTKELKEQDDYDQTWCVFDRDDWKKEDFNNTIQIAKKEGFKVAYSNEAFELWYLLHFEYIDTAIARKDYCKKLTSLLGHKYAKNSETIYDELYNKQQIALEHADKLFKSYQPSNPEKNNPSTTVHLLVKELNKFIK